MKRRTGAADLLARHAGRNKMPSSVTFQVTDRCNYDCVHCFQDHTQNPELSTDEVFRILDQLADAGILFLTLMGGEYFMRRDADAILKRSHELGFAIRLLSTGHHIHDKRADLIADLKPIQVDMSLYGPKPLVHEAVTRQPGSWKRTFEGAKRLLERQVKVLLKSPVMESNAEDLVELEALATSMGADFTLDPSITAVETGELSPTMLRMKAPTLVKFYGETMNGKLAELFVGEGEAPHKPLDHTPCRAGQETASVTPQGLVFPCNHLPIASGDLREQSFIDIWTGSAELEDVRYLQWASISECNECPVRGYCQRCHGTALAEHGTIRGPSLEACRHAVAVRDTLRNQGVIPETDTALPPTWDRVDLDGLHHEKQEGRRRPSALRVLQDS